MQFSINNHFILQRHDETQVWAIMYLEIETEMERKREELVRRGEADSVGF